MNEDQEERLVMAFENIAYLLREWFEKEHPPKREPREPIITHIQTDEEKLLEEQGWEKGELNRWLDIGTRERAFEATLPDSGIPGDSDRSRTDKTRR